MPNWCSNSVTIIGDTTKITSLGNRLKIISNDEELSGSLFKTLLGIPKNTTIQEYDNGGWYDTNISNWGTKWDINIGGEDLDTSPETISFNFESAWSPPIEAFKGIAKKYGVEVELYYEEPGNNFCGKTWIDSEGGSKAEDYGYLEGVYRFDGFDDWWEREFRWNQAEFIVEDFVGTDVTPDFEVYMRENFSFLTEEEVIECANQLKVMFEEQKEEQQG